MFFQLIFTILLSFNRFFIIENNDVNDASFSQDNICVVYNSDESEYLEDEINIDNYNSNSISVSDDNNEPNDSPLTATPLMPDDYYSLSSYETTLNGEITNDSAQDVDYFYFTLLTDSYLSLCLETEIQTCNYDFILCSYQYDDEIDLNYLNKIVNNLYADCSSSSLKEYECALEPGTYLIYLRCVVQQGQDFSLPYTLSLSIEKQNRGIKERIGDLMYNKGLPGAIWVSDFIPTGKNNISMLDYFTEFTYFSLSQSYEPDYALDSLRNISGGNPINMATIYIWDIDFRRELYSLLNDIYYKIEAEIAENEQLMLIYDSAINKIKCFTDVASFLVNSFIFDLVVDSAFLLVDGAWTIFDYLFPRVFTDCDDYMTYLHGLIMSIYVGDNEQYIGQVVKIPIYYKLIVDESSIPNLTQYRVSFLSASNDIVSMSDDDIASLYYYNDDYIYYENELSYYCRGKIYGLSKEIDNNLGAIGLENLVEINDYPYSFPVVTDALADDSVQLDGKVFDGGYQWVEFTFPRSCTYYFYARGNKELYVDVFDQIKLGYSFDGLIDTYHGGYCNGAEQGAFFYLSCNQGDKVYFRIRGEGFTALMSSDEMDDISFGAFSYEFSHNHNYNYHWLNLTKHKKICPCGVIVEEVHSVKKGSTVCLICGGTASSGIIQYSLNDNKQCVSNACLIEEFRKENEL